VATAFLEQLQSQTRIASDPLISLTDYVAEIGDRYLRGLDPSSTASGYRGSIRVRVLPVLGRLAVRSISTAAIDRTIDRWEGDCSPSTLKKTVSALTRVLDEAVRDEIIAANPARTRARRRTRSSTADLARKIPTLGEVQSLADACRRVYAAHGDFVLLSAFLAARVSEVAGLVVSDIDWDKRLVTIARQHFPGSNGLCLKPTKSRQTRRVPILKPLDPVHRRIAEDREHDQPLLRGPRGGVLTTGALSRATDWTNLVQRLGHPVCDDTTSDTPEPHGSRTPASLFTSSVTSSDTPRSRRPRATCTPTPPSSRSPRNGRTSISDGAERASTPLDFDS